MLNRRSLLAGSGALAATIPFAHRTVAQSTPTADGSPSADGPFTYTDVLGETVSLPQKPVRIAANLMTAAALWDYGIRPIAVFDWTASAYPDGDHIGWGNVDPAQVTNVGDVDGNILPEDLKALEPDLILTLSYDASNPADTAGITVDYAEEIRTIAPVLVVTDQDSTEIQLQRLLDVAVALGGDIETEEVLAAKETYESRLAEVSAIAEAKADLTVLFANFDTTALWVAGPEGVADLQFVGSLGVQFANADAAAATEFWEELSLELVDTYPSDIVYNDVYSAFQTVEELQGQPAFATMPAVSGGQIGSWLRDFPVNYAGMTVFLDAIIEPLRTATKLT